MSVYIYVIRKLSVCIHLIQKPKPSINRFEGLGLVCGNLGSSFTGVRFLSRLLYFTGFNHHPKPDCCLLSKFICCQRCWLNLASHGPSTSLCHRSVSIGVPWRLRFCKHPLVPCKHPLFSHESKYPSSLANVPSSLICECQ